MTESPPAPRGLIGLHQIPNLLCIGRVIAVFIALAILGQTYADEGHWSTPCIVVMTIAALTDRLDGFLAKRYGWATRLGALLDQISDKLVTLALFTYLGLVGAFPLWGLALIIFRELFVTGLRISANLERIAIPTSQAGRFKTFTQQVAVLIIFLHWAYPADLGYGLTFSQGLLWSGWLVFWVVMAFKRRTGFAAFRRIYTVLRVDPTSGEESRAHADLVLVWATIAAMGVPLPWGGPAVVLIITVGTGATYLSAYRWARRVRGVRGGAGGRNIALTMVGSGLLAVGLGLALHRWPTLPVMWLLIAALSVAWSVLCTASYLTGEKAKAVAAAEAKAAATS